MNEHLEAKTKQSKNSTIQITVNLASNIKPSNKVKCLGINGLVPIPVHPLNSN